MDGTVDANIRFDSGAATSFKIVDGLAMSNAGALSDGNPANALPLNAAATGSASRLATLTIAKGSHASRLSKVRDVLLWVEYSVP
jgi:hypothetical protein